MKNGKCEIYWKNVIVDDGYLWLENTVDRFFDISFKDMSLGEFFVPMGGEPNPGQRALFGQDEMRVKHVATISLSFCKIINNDKEVN